MDRDADVYSSNVFFVKQKTAYEVRISDWSSDVCSSDLRPLAGPRRRAQGREAAPAFLAAPRAISEMASKPDPLVAIPMSKTSAMTWVQDRKSVVSGKSVSVRVHLGCRRCFEKKNNSHKQSTPEYSTVIPYL